MCNLFGLAATANAICSRRLQLALNFARYFGGGGGCCGGQKHLPATRRLCPAAVLAARAVLVSSSSSTALRRESAFVVLPLSETRSFSPSKTCTRFFSSIIYITLFWSHVAAVAAADCSCTNSILSRRRKWRPSQVSDGNCR